MTQPVTRARYRNMPWTTLQQWWTELRLKIRTRRQRSVRSLQGKVTWDGDIDASRVGRVIED